MLSRTRRRNGLRNSFGRKSLRTARRLAAVMEAMDTLRAAGIEDMGLIVEFPSGLNVRFIDEEIALGLAPVRRGCRRLEPAGPACVDLAHAHLGSGRHGDGCSAP